MLPEEKKLVEGVGDGLIVCEKRLGKLGVYDPFDLFFKEFRISPDEYGFSYDLLNKASVVAADEVSEGKLRGVDLQIIQMINAFDELNQISNLLLERRERWSVLPDSENKIKPVMDAFRTINEDIEKLKDQIEEDMKKIAPNVYALVGSLIGARLISHAGGLYKLALLPSSTVQLLGAEKAFFRFKKEGGRPPKHGVIFQHPMISKSPREKRGRIARVLSSKITVAAKADVFTNRDISDKLKKELEVKFREILNLRK